MAQVDALLIELSRATRFAGPPLSGADRAKFEAMAAEGLFIEPVAFQAVDFDARGPIRSLCRSLNRGRAAVFGRRFCSRNRSRGPNVISRSREFLGKHSC
jgi:hypothetical protein